MNRLYRHKWLTLFAPVIPILIIWSYFEWVNPIERGDDQYIIAFFLLPWIIGLVVSAVTTEEYRPRSLGIWWSIAGDVAAYSFLILSSHRVHAIWLQNVIRSIFLVAAPIFLYGTIITLKERRDLRRTKKPPIL